MENEQKQAIQELASLLHENNLSEIEYESNGVYLHIVGPKTKCETAVVSSALVSSASEVVSPKPVEERKPENHIVSPMVGVVYLSKDPSAPAFVKVGDRVSVGQTVCLVEAMKTFNPIKSDKAGIVSEILVESGNPVEYNQPLFNLE